MAEATGKARATEAFGRFDTFSVLFLLLGVGLIAATAWCAWLAYGFFSSVPRTLVIDERILRVIQGVFLTLLASLTARYAYRFVRMMDPGYRREYKRLQAPRVRELRHTLHLVRRSPLTLSGVIIIALFVVVALLAALAPAVIAPYPQDAGAVYYRGEFFQPPFSRTHVVRNETIAATYSWSGWIGWTGDETTRIPPCPCPVPLGGAPLNWTIQAEPIVQSANVARSNLSGETFVAGGFRLDDVYTPDIQFVGVQIRERASPGNRLAVSLSWDGGATWSSPLLTSGRNFSATLWAETVDFTSATQWTPEKLASANFRVRVEHVTDPLRPEGPAEIDFLSVRVNFDGKYVLLGTDELGRDYLSRIIMAAPLDLLIAIVVVTSALLIGVVLGVVSGYYGGWVDEAIMRVTDIFLSIPGLILALAFTAALGPGLLNVMTALVITWWPGYTRLIRAQTLSVRENLYVEAARAVGVPSGRIVIRHVLPNSIAPVLVNATLDMGTVILVASALSFLGLGVQPPDPEWGAMVSDGRFYIIAQGWWWLSTFPGLAILFASLGFNLAGDGLRDILDPRLRR